MNDAEYLGGLAALLKARRVQRAAFNALKVVELTPHIRTYLEATDPKALEQVVDAANALGETFDLKVPE